MEVEGIISQEQEVASIAEDMVPQVVKRGNAQFAGSRP